MNKARDRFDSIAKLTVDLAVPNKKQVVVTLTRKSLERLRAVTMREAFKLSEEEKSEGKK